MCDILIAVLEIIINIVATFSGNLAGSFAEIGYEFLGEVFGCRTAPNIILPS